MPYLSLMFFRPFPDLHIVRMFDDQAYPLHSFTSPEIRQSLFRLFIFLRGYMPETFWLAIEYFLVSNGYWFSMKSWVRIYKIPFKYRKQMVEIFCRIS